MHSNVLIMPSTFSVRALRQDEKFPRGLSDLKQCLVIVSLKLPLHSLSKNEVCSPLP